MKKLTIYLMLFMSCQVFSIQAQAGLIELHPDKLNYSAGETININFMVNNHNQYIAEIDYDFFFNSDLVSFEEFNFSEAAVNDAIFTDSYLKDDNTLNIYTLWFESLDVQVGQFTLGTASFMAKSAVDFNPQNFELADVYIGDDSGTEIDNNVVDVPEPSSVAVMFSGLLLMAGLRKKKNNT